MPWRRQRGMRSSRPAVLALLIACLTACSDGRRAGTQQRASSPVIAVQAPVVPRAAVEKSVCLLRKDSPPLRKAPHRAPLLAVDSSPASVLLVWRPGLNGPCRVVQRRLGRAAAQRLAAAMDSAGPSPFDQGTFSCPADDGTAVDLWFATSVGWQRMMLPFGGCSALLADDRGGRSVPPVVVEQVRAAFPGLEAGPDPS